MKFDTKTVISAIDFSNYSDLYPGYDSNNLSDDDFMFDSEEKCKEHINNIIELFDNFPNEFPVYRSIKVNSKEDIDMEYLGESWSFDLQSAKEFGRHNGSNIILSAIVTDDNVDWYESLWRYLRFSDAGDSDDENEIVVEDTNKLKNLTINKMKEAKEIGKNPIFTREPYVKSFENWLNEFTNYENIINKNFVYDKSKLLLTESFSKQEDILPKEILEQIQKKLKFKQFKRINSGRYGTAFKISSTKVLKITKDLKEYEYAKKIEGLKNKHIADVYKTYHFTYDDTKYAIIIKEFCLMDEYGMDRMIDSFVEYTGGEMSLSFVSSEYLRGDMTKRVFDYYFEKYKRNKGYYDSDVWYEMIMELKEKKIYVKDFNGSNIGMKLNNNLCIIELGLGWWENIIFSPDDHIDLNQN